MIVTKTKRVIYGNEGKVVPKGIEIYIFRTL